MRVPYSDGVGSFEVEGPCVGNVYGIRVPMWWVEDNVDVDWALMLLAISGGYVSAGEMLEYALLALNDESSREVYELAISTYETHPDCSGEERAVAAIAARIGESQWAFARERLFYVVAFWTYLNCLPDKHCRYELAADIGDIWIDLGRPANGDALFNTSVDISRMSTECLCAYGVPWPEEVERKWHEFVTAERIRLRPRKHVAEIAPEPGSRWDAGSGLAPIIPSQMVAEPMGFLLSGDDPVLRQLRRQYCNSRIVGEENSGCGFLVDFEVPDHVPDLEDCEPSFAFGDVYACSGDETVGFLVFVRKGRLTMLESYSAFEDDWPPKGESFCDMRFEPNDGDPLARDLEQIRNAWTS